MYFYVIDILCHQFNVNQLNACLLPLFYMSCMTLYMYSAHEKQSKVWIESNRSLCCHRKWQDYVYIQCEYKSTKQKIKHLLWEENKVKENKIS